MASFRSFIIAVWNHWEARFGTTFAVALATVQYITISVVADPKKLPDWVKTIPPQAWLWIGLVFLLWSCYASWHEERSKLEALRARLASPEFKINIDSMWFGHRGKNFMVVLGVTVSNPLGPPSSVKDWRVHIKHNGEDILAEIPLLTGRDIVIPLSPDPHKNITLRPDLSLIHQTVDPIPVGGFKSGWMMAVSSRMDYIATGDIITISGKDVVGENEHHGESTASLASGLTLPGEGNIKRRVP